jgi:hypothetical protein
MERIRNQMKIVSLIAVIITMVISMSSPSPVFSVEMGDYCSIPPFVGATTGAPPNIMLVYEKGEEALKRAYSTTYDSNETYYGFFDTTANYFFATDANRDFEYFEKSACIPSSVELECIPGNILNWALMSSLDLSRKALAGFGWPEPGFGKSAGEVFTYSGPWNVGGGNDPTPRSVGQWDGDEPANISVTRNIDGSDYTYSFCLFDSTGSNPTLLKVMVRSGTSPVDSCSGIQFCDEFNELNTGRCLGDGSVIMKFAEEDDRRGVFQKLVDKDGDLIYDEDAPRIGVRRFDKASDKNLDILCDDPSPSAGCDSNCDSDDLEDMFSELLTKVSKAPPAEPGLSPVADMTVRISGYFEEDPKAGYTDNDKFTQTPYSWCSDTAGSCRDTHILFITTGNDSGTEVFSSLHPDCSPALLGTDAYFAQNVCHAYKSDLTDTLDGLQNIVSSVIHTTFYGRAGLHSGQRVSGWRLEPQMERM